MTEPPNESKTNSIIQNLLLAEKSLNPFGLEIKRVFYVRENMLEFLKHLISIHKLKTWQGRNEFYQSWEWKELRYKALKKYGRRCMCCGFKPTPGSSNYIVVDHVKPVSKYPRLALKLSSLQILCNDCNCGKSNKYYDDYRP